jgi:hypothetical protein
MIAISSREYEKYGCPNCGCDFAVGGSFVMGGCTTGTCEECKLTFELLPDGMSVSRVGFGTNRKDADGKEIMEYPRRIEHPRKGIPKHAYEWPDPRPEGGGEFWYSRGIGYDLSGFVKSKKAGERLLEMVKEVLGVERPKTWLDYREFEPKRIQFKFQSEEFDLEKLDKMAGENNDIVTKEILIACKKG